jgi:hypothetical protein
MSDKMRRYIIAFCILLMLSVFHSALAAPVAVGEIREVPSNAVDVLKDGIAAREKRMDPGGEDRTPGSDSDPGVTDAPVGQNEEDVGSDPKEPNPHHKSPPENLPEEESDNVNGDDVVNSDADGNDKSSGGYNAEEKDEEDNVQSEQSSVEEHPAVNPEDMTDLEKLFSALRISPRRNSGAGAVGTPKRELQGTVDVKTYVSDSSLPLQTAQGPSHRYSNPHFND